MIKLLIVGSFKACYGPEEASGTVVSLRYLVEDLKNSEEAIVETVDIGSIRRGEGSRKGTKAISLFGRIKELWLRSKSVDLVSLHLSPMGFAVFGPFALCIARIRRKPITFRLFGGMDYESLPFAARCIAKVAIRRMDCVFAQTKALRDAFSARGLKNVVWYPTTRPMPAEDIANPHDSDAKDYIYVGHIKLGKGIVELVEAFRQLGPAYRLNVYGPFYDNLNEEVFADVSNVTYGGVLAHNDVRAHLEGSKALVFPTYLPAEGYSGIILESFGAGLPVICTEWNYLPELVDNECGILIEPRNVQAIVDAVRSFDSDIELQQRLSDGSYARRTEYSLKSARKRFLDECHQLSGFSG